MTTSISSSSDGTVSRIQLNGNDSIAINTSGIVLPKTPGVGIQCDTTTPTWGWHDLLGEITIKAAGSNDPTYSTFLGNLKAFEFSATVMKEVFVNYHIPHDYVPGTDIYFHAHWSNSAVTPNTGNVVWGFEYSFAKGHQQAAFPTTTTVTAIQASSSTRYYHHIAETAAVTIPSLEPDGLLMVRIHRDAANGSDTCTDTAFLLMTDVHYQSTNVSTKNKTPNFYT